MRYYALSLVVCSILLVFTRVYVYMVGGASAQLSTNSAYMLGPTSAAAITILRQRFRRRTYEQVRRGVGSGYELTKRSIDILLASVAIIMAAPVCLVIAILVRLDSAGPIIHRRMVIGKNGKLFPMFKFRTMVPDAERILQEDEELRRSYYEGNCKLQSDPRVTRLGKVLRKTSLDELPQFVNILLGQMSLVGPRPIASDEVELYGPQVERFKLATPGVTGLWQTSGRSETSYAKRVELDMMYLENRSTATDLRIILMTLPSVMLKRGAV